MILSTADPYTSVEAAEVLLQADSFTSQYTLQIKCIDPTRGNDSTQTGITSYYKAYNTNNFNRKVAFTGFFLSLLNIFFP